MMTAGPGCCRDSLGSFDGARLDQCRRGRTDRRRRGARRGSRRRRRRWRAGTRPAWRAPSGCRHRPAGCGMRPARRELAQRCSMTSVRSTAKEGITAEPPRAAVRAHGGPEVALRGSRRRAGDRRRSTRRGRCRRPVAVPAGAESGARPAEVAAEETARAWTSSNSSRTLDAPRMWPAGRRSRVPPSPLRCSRPKRMREAAAGLASRPPRYRAAAPASAWRSRARWRKRRPLPAGARCRGRTMRHSAPCLGSA